MKRHVSRFIRLAVLLCAILSIGCESDFYLSEKEAAACASLIADESSANNFASSDLPTQFLDIEFDNASSPPTIRSMNLVDLMRNHTTLGIAEGVLHQVQLDRINSELQTQIERYVRKKLQIYTGSNNAAAKLTQLSSLQIRFLNRPTFTFHPERQAIAFSLSIRLTVRGTIEVDALDTITNFIFGINGTYPLVIDVNNLALNGEATFPAPFANASRITLNITPQPGTVTVTDDNSSSSPGQVKDGVRSFITQQLSQPLSETFLQQFDYFALTNLGLAPGIGQTPSAFKYTYQPRPEISKPLLHIAARGADGKLYHLRKIEGGKGIVSSTLPFPNLQTRIVSDPSLFASATDQLELAATNVNGDLIYAHWRDEAWINQTTFAAGTSAQSGYAGKPTIIASAPGQVEIIAMGRNGGLWHLRRVNGVWLSPINIPLAYWGVVLPAHDPSVVQSGNKIIVAFADAQNNPRAVAFDLESAVWGQPTGLFNQETIRYAPAIAASGDGRVDVVYIGQSGTPYHRTLNIQTAMFQTNAATTGISIVGAEANIGGNVTASPVLTCSSSAQLELIARGTDNNLYHNHFSGPLSPTGIIDGRTLTPGWQGWGDLNGDFPGSSTLSNDQMTVFSAAATRTGKIEVIAVVQPSVLNNNSDQYLFQNSYDSERFGRQLWKTVLWRGFEQTGQQRFLGQPALALTEGHVALAYVGSKFTVQRARLAESDYALFTGIDNSTTINNKPEPVDMAAVSSLPGYTDFVFVGADGKLRHIRSKNSGGGITTIIPTRVSSTTFIAPPAIVSYGNGQLEVAATANDHALYHWRYQNGVWTYPAQLSGAVSFISQPALIHLGDGQLVALAVGADQHLYGWYFAGGVWTNFSSAQQVSTNFSINAVLFGQTVASSSGEGSIDLALVEAGTNALHHGRLRAGYFMPGFNLGLTPGLAFTNIGGTLIDTPILNALSPTRLNVLAIGTDHIVYSAWASRVPNILTCVNCADPLMWSGYDSIGGYNLLLGGVAKSGANEMTAIGIDTSGHVLTSRFNGAKWIQFQPVIGQSLKSQLSPPLYRPAIASYGN